MEKSAARVALVKAIQHLEQALDATLASMRMDWELPAWVWQQEGERARESAIQAISQIEYEDGQMPNAALFCPGLLGASRETLALAKALNEAKDHLKKAFQSMQPFKVKVEEGGRTITLPLATYTLQSIGRARLHRIQAFRKLVIMEERPDRLGFTWAHTRTIVRIDADEARRKLLRLGSDAAIEAQLEKLELLSPGEKLAVVLPTATHARVNVAWRKGGQVVRRQVKSALPILIPCRAGQPLP
ncbi:MAG: hypothetical protein D6819_01030, partial [Gammaproteobacteria bacterium]